MKFDKMTFGKGKNANSHSGILRNPIAIIQGIAKRPLEIRKDYAQGRRNLSTSYSSIKIWRFKDETLSKFTLKLFSYYFYIVSIVIVPYKNHALTFPVVHIIENSTTAILFNNFSQINFAKDRFCCFMRFFGL
jgi:hypothetical protein